MSGGQLSKKAVDRPSCAPFPARRTPCCAFQIVVEPGSGNMKAVLSSGSVKPNRVQPRVHGTHREMARGKACVVPPPPPHSRAMPVTPTPLPNRVRRRGNIRFRKTRLSANRPPGKRRSRLPAKRRVVLLRNKGTGQLSKKTKGQRDRGQATYFDRKLADRSAPASMEPGVKWRAAKLAPSCRRRHTPAPCQRHRLHSPPAPSGAETPVSEKPVFWPIARRASAGAAWRRNGASCS